MKRSTQIISGGSTTSLNIPNLSFKNNAELAKAFDVLYFHASPNPKPFPGYTSLENVVSKNLKVSNADFLNKRCNQSQFHVSPCSLHSSLDPVNTSLESYGSRSLSASHRSSTGRIIQAIKERHAQLIHSTGNETVLNTFSVIKDKRNVSPSQESCESKDSTTDIDETNDSLHCNEKDVLVGKVKNSTMKTRDKNYNLANGLTDDINEAQIVLKKCDNMINRTKKQQPSNSNSETSPDENKVTIKAADMNILTDWIIKPVPGCNGVCVEGKKMGMEDYWHSTAIAEVRKPKVVVTISGSVYRLKGRINKLCTIDNGFPKEIATSFANGFPNNWRELIQKYFINVEKSISFHKEEISLKKKKCESRSKKSQLSDNKTNTEDMLEKTIMTRNGLIQQQFNVSDMVVTRSGRISLPPLKRWVGQHYVMDSNSKTITVACKTKPGEDFLSQETQQILQTSKAMQKDIFHKSLSNTLNCPSSLSSHSKENMNKTFPNPKGRKPDRAVRSSTRLRRDSDKGKSLSLEMKQKTKKERKRGNSVTSESDKSIEKNKRKRTQACSELEDSVKQKKGRTQACSELEDSVKQKKGRTQACSELGDSVKQKKGRTQACSQLGDSVKEKNGRTQACSQLEDSVKQKKGRTQACSELEDSVKQKKGRTQACSELGDSVKQKKGRTQACSELGDSVKQKNGRTQACSELEDSVKQKKGRTQACSELEGSVKQKKGRTQVSEDSDKSLVQKKKRKRSGELDRLTEGKRRKTQNSSLSSQHNDLPPEDNCFSLDLVNRKPTSSRSRKRKHSASEKEESETKKLNVDEEKTSDAWTEREQNLFHRALQIISSAESNFWIKVSQFVRSRSDVECQEFHTNYLETVGKPKIAINKPKKENQNKGRQKGEPIKGGKGTLKRKKDLRAFLDEQNEGYEDDLFESSPMLRKKPKSLLNFDFPQNDSDIFGQNHNFFTPVPGGSAIDTPSTNIRAAIASVRKGLLDQGGVTEETPISSKRQKGDMIIKHFNDRKKKGLSFPEQKEVSKDLELSSLPVKSLFTPVARPRISIDCNEDDDDKPLYYWDDDD